MDQSSAAAGRCHWTPTRHPPSEVPPRQDWCSDEVPTVHHWPGKAEETASGF